MSADESKETEEMADLDGPLVDYKSKGHQVELQGKEKIEGTDAYKLKVTLKNGDVQTIYIDSDSFLEIKEVTKRTIRGTEQEIESAIGDYKAVNGIMIASNSSIVVALYAISGYSVSRRGIRVKGEVAGFSGRASGNGERQEQESALQPTLFS